MEAKGCKEVEAQPRPSIPNPAFLPSHFCDQRVFVRINTYFITIFSWKKGDPSPLFDVAIFLLVLSLASQDLTAHSMQRVPNLDL